MPRFPFAVVVFDLDGTLIDTAPDLTAALNEMLRQLGREQLSQEAVLGMIGRGMRRLVENGVRATGPMTPALVEAGMAIFLEHYETHLADASQPYADVEITLDLLRERGARLALCTNKPERFARALLNVFGWTERFTAVVGGDTLPTRKPDAEPLREAISRAGGGRAVLVGDSMVDAQTARAAGVPLVAVTFGYRDRPAEELAAQGLIDRFDQLVPTLEKWQPD